MIDGAQFVCRVPIVWQVRVLGSKEFFYSDDRVELASRFRHRESVTYDRNYLRHLLCFDSFVMKLVNFEKCDSDICPCLRT